MVATVHIDRWDVTRILIDNGSQDEILFMSAFKKMGYDKKQLKEPTKPLYGFGRKRIEPIRVITLPISFGTPQNPCIEYITFDVADMLYPYTTIIGQRLLNTFEAAMHSRYLCVKISATFSIISIFGSQKEARNIACSFAPGHKNIHFLREDIDQQMERPINMKALAEFKKAIEAKGDFKKVALDPRIPDKAVCIGIETTLEEQAELLEFLDKNCDIFVWSTSDLMGVSREIIEHKLQVHLGAKPMKQKLHKMSEEKVEPMKDEVQGLPDAGFIREVTYPQWLANLVMVRKKNEKW
jgi:hypothetical protein